MLLARHSKFQSDFKLSQSLHLYNPRFLLEFIFDQLSEPNDARIKAIFKVNKTVITKEIINFIYIIGLLR